MFASCFYSGILIGLQSYQETGRRRTKYNNENDMITWIKKIFTRLLQYEQCVATFTLSCCMGIYIAFCPFVGFHTAMVFVFSWLFALNVSVVLAVSVLINNPWTMLPVYGFSYFCGDWILSWLGALYGFQKEMSSFQII